eukprot:scaffold48803_cov29-Prasinocladus_malaysianus.AAC.1
MEQDTKLTFIKAILSHWNVAVSSIRFGVSKSLLTIGLHGLQLLMATPTEQTAKRSTHADTFA